MSTEQKEQVDLLQQKRYKEVCFKLIVHNNRLKKRIKELEDMLMGPVNKEA